MAKTCFSMLYWFPFKHSFRCTHSFDCNLQEVFFLVFKDSNLHAPDLLSQVIMLIQTVKESNMKIADAICHFSLTQKHGRDYLRLWSKGDNSKIAMVNIVQWIRLHCKIVTYLTLYVNLEAFITLKLILLVKCFKKSLIYIIYIPFQ